MPTVTLIAAVIGTLRTRLAAARAEGDRGSFSLEQAVIAAALLAMAIGLTAVLIAAISNHESSIK